VHRQDRDLLKRLSVLNGLMGEVVLKLLSDAEESGDLPPESLSVLADALGSVASELMELVTLLRQRSGDPVERPAIEHPTKPDES
jgi:hypothetical protein